MKKIIITAVVTLIASICFGQYFGIQPSVYTPIYSSSYPSIDIDFSSGYSTYTPSYNSSRVQQSQTKRKAQTQIVTAYYVENDRFVRTSIKVREPATAYTSMEVVEYLVRSDYGSYWQSVTAFVEKVTSADASVIRDNFYYKAYIITLGTWFYF